VRFQLIEAGEDRSDYVLQTQIGVQSKPRLPVPNVTERNGKSQFAASRFRSGGIQHAGSQHAEFELTDTALHSQKQPVVRAARVVDTVVIYDTGLNEAAWLKQMVLVATITCEA
jgi:hypothetical protein